MGATAKIVYNRFPEIRRRFPREVDQIVREQIKVTEGDVKTNIVKYNAIDTSNMINSVDSHPTGHAQGEVTVSAQSEQGYPYPTAVNFGYERVDGVRVPGRPFFSEAIIKAEDEFPERFKELESRL